MHLLSNRCFDTVLSHHWYNNFLSQVRTLLPAFRRALTSNDDEKVFLAFNCYNMLFSHATDEQLASIVTSDLVGTFVRLLSHHTTDIVFVSVGILGLLLGAEDTLTQR